MLKYVSAGLEVLLLRIREANFVLLAATWANFDVLRRGVPGNLMVAGGHVGLPGNPGKLGFVSLRIWYLQNGTPNTWSYSWECSKRFQRDIRPRI